jgi:N-acetylglucosamine kinase-like BadF-type ATPase
MSRYYIGVDAGQTHLEAVLMNEEGKIEARGFGGASHIQGESIGKVFEDSLSEAIRNFSKMEIRAVGAGISGIGIPGKREIIKEVMKEKFQNSSIYLDNDAVTSHWSCTEGKKGASIIAGTGSIFYGVHEGKSIKLGGFGYLFGDEGGGVWIGLTAIRRALRSYEGYDYPTSLVETINNYFNLEQFSRLVGFIYQHKGVPVARIAGLAKLVFKEALKGDQLSQEIVNQAAKELANNTIHLLKKLTVSRQEEFPVYLLGGIWNAGEAIICPYKDIVHSEFPSLLWFERQGGDPAFGAALMAKTYDDLPERGGWQSEH